MQRIMMLWFGTVWACGAHAVTLEAPDADTEGPDQAPEYERLFPADRVVDLDLVIAQEDWDAMMAKPLEDIWVPATLTYDGIVVPDIAIRLKGNSSRRVVAEARSERFSFKLDLDRQVVGQNLLGVDKINLNNVMKDPSYLRERLAAEIYASAGVLAPRTTYARVTRSGELFGLYVVVEQVDKDFLRDRFGDDSGNLYKPEIPSGDLMWRGDSIDAYPEMDLKTNEETADHSALLELLDVLNHKDVSELEAALGPLLNVDNLLRWLAVTTALVNLDSYAGTGHNYYLYRDPGSGAFQMIAWDVNEAFGNFTCSYSPSALIELSHVQPICGDPARRPLIMRILDVPAWKTAYEGYLREWLAGSLSASAIAARVETLSNLIRPDVEADPTRFFSVADFEQSLDQDVIRGPLHSFGLTSFIERRGAALNAKLP